MRVSTAAICELRDALLKGGYPAKNPKNFYTQVFVAASKDKGIRKTGAGFTLARRAGRRLS